MPGRYHLYRGDVLLGTLSNLQPDFPWVVGSFEPSDAFAAERPLFERELELLDAEHYDEWEELWTRIAAPGLRILPVDPGEEPVEDFNIIHLRGDRFDFR
jgi:hypothetical protein